MTGPVKAAVIVRLLLAEGSPLPLSSLPEHMQAALTEQIGRMRLVDRTTLGAVVEEFLNELEQVGLSFPGGIEGPDMFWDVIKSGSSVIEKVPFSRWDAEAEAAADPTLSEDVKRRMMYGGFVRDLELFDASFFGISAAEAKAMDPQQRLLLECAYLAFVDAGYTKESLVGRNVGVF
jgi:hypothetical protein